MKVVTVGLWPGRGGGGGGTQSMSVGNICGPLHPQFLGFHCFQNWQMNTAPIFGHFPKLFPTGG